MTKPTQVESIVAGLSEAVGRLKVAWKLFLGFSECTIFGHQNTGDYYHSVRVWQRCGRCEGWLGWMFHWETPWTREDGLEALAVRKALEDAGR